MKSKGGKLDEVSESLSGAPGGGKDIITPLINTNNTFCRLKPILFEFGGIEMDGSDSALPFLSTIN